MKLTVSFSSGTVKVIDAGKWLKTIGAGGVWEDATAISTNTELNKNDHQIPIFQDNQIFEIELSTGSSESKKGLYIPVGFETIVVKSISGTVKRLKYDLQTYATKIEDVFGSPDSVNVSSSDVLFAGDIISLDTSTDIDIEFSLGECNMYMKTGFDVIGLSNEL